MVHPGDQSAAGGKAGLRDGRSKRKTFWQTGGALAAQLSFIGFRRNLSAPCSWPRAFRFAKRCCGAGSAVLAERVGTFRAPGREVLLPPGKGRSHPPFSFRHAEKKTGRGRSKRKGRSLANRERLVLSAKLLSAFAETSLPPAPGPAPSVSLGAIAVVGGRSNPFLQVSAKP